MRIAERFDVAAGGMAAHDLTKSGAKVLMLEAGRDYDPQTAPQSAPIRGSVTTTDKPTGFFDVIKRRSPGCAGRTICGRPGIGTVSMVAGRG